MVFKIKNMCKNWFENIRLKLKEHFKVENINYNLHYILKKSLRISVGLDEIYFGTKNPKRFILCKIHRYYNVLLCLLHISFLTSNFMFSLIKTPYISDLYNPVIVITSLAVLTEIVHRDLLYCENKWNLSQFKICYLLAKNIKAKHKLNEQNYNRLALLLRIKVIALLYLAFPISLLAVIILGIVLFFKTGQLVWVVYEIVIVPYYMSSAIFLITITIRFMNVILYYKMRFDQLNQQIKSF